MLKGHTTIELTDVNTGKKEAYEDDNMITGALNEIFKDMGFDRMATLKDSAPFIYTLLGGMICFDSELPETAETFFPPASANFVAGAAYDYTNTTTETGIGSYNKTESKAEDGKVTFVYDFTTSQGNGTIASVCLTHKQAAFSYYGHEGATKLYRERPFFSTGTSNGRTLVIENYHPFLASYDEDVIYYFRIENTSSLSIVQYKGNMKTMSVFDKLSTPEIKDSESVDVELANTNVYSYNYDPSNGCLYICQSQTAAQNAALTVIVYDMATKNASITTVTNTADKTINGASAYFHGGYMYTCATGDAPYTWYRFNLTNSADVVKLDGTTEASDYWTGMPLGDSIMLMNNVYYGSYAEYYNYIIRDTEVLPTNSYRYYGIYPLQGIIPISETPLTFLIGYNSQVVTPYGYLATINNLSNPVVKTADKTMKITYTVTEV